MSETAKLALISAGERLFAERGVNAVSLREVGAAAGHRNNSAAQYHFGSRDGLVDAIFKARMAPIDAHRNRLLDEVLGTGRQRDVRALVEALVYPLAHGLGEQGTRTWYARFLAQMLADPSFRLLAPPRDEVTTGLSRLVDHLRTSLPHLAAPIRDFRIELAASLVVHGFADHERAEERGGLTSVRNRALVAAHLVDAVVGLLEAPASPEVEQLLAPATQSAR